MQMHFVVDIITYKLSKVVFFLAPRKLLMYLDTIYLFEIDAEPMTWLRRG